MPPPNDILGKRYPFGESMKTERVIYEAPPPPPKPGEYPRKPPFWDMTRTTVGKEMNRNMVFVTLGLAGFAVFIMYYCNPKMNRVMKHLTGSSRATPDKIEMEHARKNNFLKYNNAMNVDKATYDVALQRMGKLQGGVYTPIGRDYADFPMKWASTQPEDGLPSNT